MSWFLLNILAVLALASAELLQQKILIKKDAFSPRTSAILTYFFQAVLTFIFLFFTPLLPSLFFVFTPTLLPLLLLVTFLSSFAMVLYLRSFQVKNISFSSIFQSVSIPVSVFLGILFFHESTTVEKFVGILFILISIFVLNFRNAVLEKNHFYGLLAGVLFGICFVLDKSIVLATDPLIYMFWVFLLAAVFGFLQKPTEVIHAVRQKPLSAYRLIVASGLCYFLFNLFTYNAYRLGGEVGKIDAINNTQVFIFILFEFFILKHKTSLWRKILSAILAYIGVFILGLH